MRLWEIMRYLILQLISIENRPIDKNFINQTILTSYNFQQSLNFGLSWVNKFSQTWTVKMNVYNILLNQLSLRTLDIEHFSSFILILKVFFKLLCWQFQWILSRSLYTLFNVNYSYRVRLISFYGAIYGFKVARKSI